MKLRVKYIKHIVVVQSVLLSKYYTHNVDILREIHAKLSVNRHFRCPPISPNPNLPNPNSPNLGLGLGLGIGLGIGLGLGIELGV